MLELEHLLHTGLHNAQVLFVRMQPFLIGILQRGRQRRHDLATVAEITSNLGPFLLFADTLKATPGLYSLFELVEIKWSLVHTREPSKAVAMLFVKLCKLIQIIQVGTCAWLYQHICEIVMGA